MGTDIHGWVEKRLGDKWVALAKLRDDERIYERFSMLAGVRGCGPSARGLPSELSDTVSYWAVRAEYTHSHSWLPLAEALVIFIATSGRECYTTYELCGADIDGISDCRLVFWFDS